MRVFMKDVAGEKPRYFVSYLETGKTILVTKNTAYKMANISETKIHTVTPAEFEKERAEILKAGKKKNYMDLLNDRIELEKEKGLVDFHFTINPDCKDKELIAKGLLEMFDQRGKSKPVAEL